MSRDVSVAQARVARQRRTMGKNLSMQEFFAYDVGVRPPAQTFGVVVVTKAVFPPHWGGKAAFGDWGVRASFLGGKSHGKRCTWQAAFFWREITLTVVGFYAQSKAV